MTDHSKLKRLAEALIEHASDSYYLPCVIAYERAANPAAVLALLAEVEGLRVQNVRDSASICNALQARDDARKERDQLKAENKRLSALLECSQGDMLTADKIIAERDRLLSMFDCPDHGQCVPHAIEQVEALRKDRQRLNFLESQNHKTLKFHKKKWSFQGFTNYEYSVFSSLREAIDDAMNEVG